MDSHDTFSAAGLADSRLDSRGIRCHLRRHCSSGGFTASGSPGGRVLKRLPEGSTLPWHRVVNRHGDISLTGPDLQRQRQALLAEGVQVSGSGHIDLQHYRWIY